MTVKPGVSVIGVTPEAVFGLLVVYSVYLQRNVPLRITSCVEGKHMKGSLHPRGKAWDVGLVGDDREVVTALRNALGAEWDVVLEKDHVHIEFDPK